MVSPDLLPVPFRNVTLFLVDLDGFPYVPMRPVVEGMGLDWKSQHVKLTQNQRFASSVVEITTQMSGDDQRRAMTCLPLRKLPGWLTSISPNKVALEIRDTVIAYQNECDDALWASWTEGHAINPRTAAPQPTDPIIGALVHGLMEIDAIKQQNTQIIQAQTDINRKAEILENRVQNVELQHRNGVPEGYLSKSQAHHLYGRGLSEDVFHRAMKKIGVAFKKYIHRGEDGHDVSTLAYLEGEIESAVALFLSDAKQATAQMCESPMLDGRRFRYVKATDGQGEPA